MENANVTAGVSIKVDARKQPGAQLLERRRLVIQLHHQGVPVMQIVAQTGLHWATVNNAIKQHKAGGESALLPSTRGRKQGTGRALTSGQEAQIRQLILQRRPWFYQLHDSLWTRDAVASLIEQKIGVRLSARGVSNYLTRWGLALPTPSKRPQERCSAEVRTWIAAKLPEVERDANDREGEIYWINKPVPLAAALWHRTASTKDPESDSNAGSLPAKKRWMVSAVNRQGTLRWAIADGAFNADRQSKFVANLLKDAIGNRKKPLILIRTELSLCSSQDFMYWVHQNQADIKIFPD